MLIIHSRDPDCCQNIVFFVLRLFIKNIAAVTNWFTVWVTKNKWNSIRTQDKKIIVFKIQNCFLNRSVLKDHFLYNGTLTKFFFCVEDVEKKKDVNKVRISASDSCFYFPVHALIAIDMHPILFYSISSIHFSLCWICN